jgi:Protein of unknown function (DUF3800)
VFQCYLDDSATSGMPIVTMAGFSAGLHLWEAMEPAFNEILDRYGVDVLHAKQFHDTDGCFKNWRKIKKQTFVDELFSVAHGKALGLSVTAKKKEFVEEKKRTGKIPSMSPYGVCFSAIMFRICYEPQIGTAVRKDGIAFLVESGNKNNDELRGFFDNYAKSKEFSPFLKSLTFIPKKSCRAIQVADFFAFYSRRAMGKHDRFDGKLALPMEGPLAIIERHVPLWQQLVRGYGLDKPVGHISDIDLTSLYPAAKRADPERSS